MPEGHRLRRLQMGETGHRIGGVLGGALCQGQHRVGNLGGQAVDGVAHPQAEIRGHLVVAAARSVQAFAGLADALRQACLDVHVDVFQRDIEGEAAGLDFCRDRV